MAERQLAVHEAGGDPVAGQLGVLRHQAPVGRVLVRPPGHEVRRGSPLDPDQRLVDVHDRPGPSGAEQDLPVLGHAAGHLLVDQAVLGDQASAGHERGRVQHRHPRADEVGRGDPVPAGQPDHGPSVDVDHHRGRREHGARLGLERGHLPTQLPRLPDVVVVAEREQVGVQVEHAGVAGTAQAGRPHVGEDGDWATVLHGLERVIRLGSVEDDADLEPTRVVLAPDRCERAPHERRPVVRHQHHADRRPPLGLGDRRRSRASIGPRLGQPGERVAVRLSADHRERADDAAITTPHGRRARRRPVAARRHRS